MSRKKKDTLDDSVSKTEEISSKRVKKNSKDTLSKEELNKKKKIHEEKIVKKQEARLSEHIERVKRKEQRGPAVNKERFYVTNAKLLNELYIWRDSAPEDRKEDRVITEEFGKMIKMIAERLTNHSNFKNYPFDLKQEMVSYAQYKCIQGIHNYNFNFKNAFAYFTTACYNSFVSTISKYYKEKNFKRDYMKKAMIKLESTIDVNSSKILSQLMKGFLQDDFEESNGKDGETV